MQSEKEEGNEKNEDKGEDKGEDKDKGKQGASSDEPAIAESIPPTKEGTITTTGGDQAIAGTDSTMGESPAITPSVNVPLKGKGKGKGKGKAGKTSTVVAQDLNEEWMWRTGGMTDDDHRELVSVVRQLQHIGYTYMGHSYGQNEKDKLTEEEWRGVFKFVALRIKSVVDQFTKDFDLFNEPVHNELERLVIWLCHGEELENGQLPWSCLPLEVMDRRLVTLCCALPLLESEDKRVR
jgi:hypothetical protein